MNSRSLQRPVYATGTNIRNGNQSIISFEYAPLGTGWSVFYQGESIPVCAHTLRHHQERQLMLSCLAVQGERERVVKPEHVFAALYLADIHDVTIILNDNICPRFDHGLAGLVRALRANSEPAAPLTAYYRFAAGRDPFVYRGSDTEGLDHVVFRAGKGVKLWYQTGLPERPVTEQQIVVDLQREEDRAKLANTRSPFPLPPGDIEEILEHARILHGVTPENTLLVCKEEVLNPNGDPNEFAHHKGDDFLGTFRASVGPFTDVHIEVQRSGHRNDLVAIKRALDAGYFERVELTPPEGTPRVARAPAWT